VSLAFGLPVALGCVVVIATMPSMQRRFPALTSRLGRFGEGVLLGAMAVVGAVVVGTLVRSALLRPSEASELARGLLIGTGLLLAGGAGLYGATLRIDRSSLVARAYHGSGVCRALLVAAAVSSLCYFAIVLASMLLEES